MIPAAIGAAAISAGSNLLGGFLQRDAQEESNAIAQRNAEENRRMQIHFAENGIKMRVDDAMRSGVHPYFALGASTSSFSPVSVGHVPEDGLAQGLRSAGQDISRAVHATSSQSERIERAHSTAATALTLQNMDLRNELLRAQIAKLKGDQVGPPLPATGDSYTMPGQADSGLVKPKAVEIAPTPAGAPHFEAGAHGDVGYARTVTGGYAPVPSKDAKDRNEDMMIPELLWAWRNNILPNFKQEYRVPPPFKAPPGQTWRWSYSGQEYRLVKIPPGRDQRTTGIGPENNW